VGGLEEFEKAMFPTFERETGNAAGGAHLEKLIQERTFGGKKKKKGYAKIPEPGSEGEMGFEKQHL